MHFVHVLLGSLLMFGTSARASDMPDLATLLALFSANAADDGRIRLNWSLDQQSPAIVKFRIYRGYEEYGSFSVLAEIPFHAENGKADYLYQDTSAIPGVTYYYKLAAQGQLNESIFPVVISAAVPLGASLGGQFEEAPVLLLPGSTMLVYLRKGGRLLIERTAPERKLLLEGEMSAGVYEIDSSTVSQTIILKLGESFSQTVNWPIQ